MISWFSDPRTMATSGGVGSEAHVCVGISDSTHERPKMVLGKGQYGFRSSENPRRSSWTGLRHCHALQPCAMNRVKSLYFLETFVNNLTGQRFTGNTKPEALPAPTCLLECYLEKMPRSCSSSSETQTQTRQDRESPDTHILSIKTKPSRSTKTITEVAKEHPDRSLVKLGLP